MDTVLNFHISKRSMLLALLNYITDTAKTAITSVAGVMVGQVAQSSNSLNVANTALQHAAWTIAIVAGLTTIINLFFPLRSFYEEYKKRKNERYLNENDKEQQQ